MSDEIYEYLLAEGHTLLPALAPDQGPPFHRERLCQGLGHDRHCYLAGHADVMSSWRPRVRAPACLQFAQRGALAAIQGSGYAC